MAAKRECTCIFMHISWPFHMHSNISMLFTMSTVINISCCKERVHQLHSSEVSVKPWTPLIHTWRADPVSTCGLTQPHHFTGRIRHRSQINISIFSPYFKVPTHFCEANLLRGLTIFVFGFRLMFRYLFFPNIVIKRQSEQPKSQIGIRFVRKQTLRNSKKC